MTIFFICLVSLLPFYSQTSIAENQGYKYWTDLNINGNLFDNDSLLYLLSLQGRFDAKKNQFEHAILVSGVGYQWLSNVSLWLGYQWNSTNQITESNQQNRIWEQILYTILEKKDINLSLRSRLEQRKEDGEPQWSNRLREKITLKFPKKFTEKITPVIFDEVFFNLNNPAWINCNYLIEQNRIFIGLDFETTKNSYLEVGYLNQYLWRQTDNVMNHVMYISYNLKL